MTKRYLIWWAYAVELLLSGLLLLALCLWFDSTNVIAFIKNTAIDTATLFSTAMFGTSLAFFWTFYSKADTEFYQWLDSRGALNTYSMATMYVVIISSLSLFSLILLEHINNDKFSLIATFLLILAIINLYTLVRNVIGLMKLNSKFNRLRRMIG